MSASVRLYNNSRRMSATRVPGWGEYFRNVFLKDSVMWLSLGLGLASCFLAAPSVSFIDFKTLACLFCLMAASAGFMRAGVFDRAAAVMTGASRDTRQLGLILVFSVFFASMIITNDVALIVFVPMALLACRKTGVNPGPVVVLQTIAANAGSALLPIGNPQNLFLFSFFDMRLADFLLAVWPVALSGGLLLAVFCLLSERRCLKGLAFDAPRVRKRETLPYVGLFLIALFAVFNILDYRLAFLLALALAAYKGRAILLQIDYALLATFVGFFIFVGNVSSVPGADAALRGLMADGAFWAAALASQVISNVPAAVLLARFTDDAAGLLAGVSAGGCGTLIASMASLISYKLYVRSCGGRGRYLALFTALNILFLLAMSAAWWLWRN